MVFLFRVLSFVPLPLLHALGAVAGWVAYFVSPAYRGHLDDNLARAVGRDAARRLRFAAAAHAGRMVLELPAVWMRPFSRTLALVRGVEGERVLADARAMGSVMFVTPHLACFEMVGQYCASLGPMVAMYRPPRRASLEALFLAGRSRGKLQLAPADLAGVRQLLRAMKKGANVGILPDQVPGFGEGVWAPFFGAPAYTMTLAARLLEAGGCTPILTCAERLSWGRGYRLHFVPLSAPLEGDLAARVAQLNREMERLILRFPAQYLWGYNRYKVPAGVELPPR